MTKPVITKKQFIDICNERLRADDMYEDGMEFMLTPEGSSEAGGYTWTTRGQVGDKTSLFAKIATAVRCEHSVV